MSAIPRMAPGTPTWDIAELFPLQGMWGEHDYTALRPGTYRKPDLVFMRARHRARMGNAFWLGADWVLDVVSDDTASRERDLVQKPLDYAEGGVPEYWLVDAALARIVVLVLDGATYREHGLFTPGQQATSATLPGFTVDVAAVFEAGRLAE